MLAHLSSAFLASTASTTIVSRVSREVVDHHSVTTCESTSLPSSGVKCIVTAFLGLRSPWLLCHSILMTRVYISFKGKRVAHLKKRIFVATLSSAKNY
jgi:hypothetical protein